MSTIRQQIRDAAIALLNADPPTGVPDTSKRRYIPGQKISDARIAAFFADEETNRIGGPGGALTQRRMVLALQCVIACENPADADDLMEPLLEHVVDTMGDTNLGNLATKVEEISTSWQAGDDGTGLFVLAGLTRWLIQYQTHKADLTRRS